MPERKFILKAVLAAILMSAAGMVFTGCPEVPKLVTYSDPLSAEEHARLGSIYEQEGNNARAVQEYGAALKKAPDNLVALVGLGNVSFAQGKPRTAVRYYERALKLDGKNVVVLNNIAMAYIQLGRFRKALTYAERAVELDGGKDPRLLDTRAQAKLGAGDRKGALRDEAAAAGLCKLYGGGAGLDAACAEIEQRLKQISGE